MKITHLCLCGPVTDGWNYQDNLLPKYHKRNGHEVTIITSKWVWGTDGVLHRDDRDQYVNENDVRMIRLEMYGKDNFSKKMKRFKNLYKAIEKTEPDILFIHGVSFKDTTVIVSYLKSNPNVIAFADNHADFSNSATNWLSKNVLHRIIWRYYARKLIPCVKKFYGVLPIRVDFLSKMYGIPKNMCELLVLGADDDMVERALKPEIKLKIRKKYNIDENDFLIITAGKIDVWKTQTLLLMEAVQRINLSNVKLLIFGSVTDELKDQVDKLADGKKVKYIGWIKTEDSYEHFAAADLVVFPGRHSVMWEQVTALGIPMIVKDWPGTHHIDLGGNVAFLTNDSVDEIYSILMDLLVNRSKYISMQKVALSEGRNRFSYNEISKRSIL